MNGVEGQSVGERAELLESALDALPEGIVISDMNGRSVFWNRSAEMITGQPSGRVIGGRVRDWLENLVVGGARRWTAETEFERQVPMRRDSLVRIRHALGYELPLLARVMTLRNALGVRIGAGVLFHPANSIDALPHGELKDDAKLSETQMQLEDRLARMHEDFCQGELPLGVLWVTVDQAAELRRSHGSRACEAMLETVESALAEGLKPTEEIGRWGRTGSWCCRTCEAQQRLPSTRGSWLGLRERQTSAGGAIVSP
jgi:PAS domain S-box-containing protein